MKPLLLTALLVAATPVLADSPNPFMSAEDRQQKILEEKKAEDAKFQKLLEKAIAEIKKETQSGASKTVSSTQDDNDYYMDDEMPELPAQREASKISDPSDFAIAAINGRHILIRQLDNKSFIVGTGQIFWDRGEAYKASLNQHGTVAIKRVSDGRTVFYGGVGSVFNPKTDVSVGRIQENNPSRASNGNTGP